jgi:hypothetical protein
VSDDFRDLLVLFQRFAVEYMVVGAHALAAHGVPRVTGDLDLWVRPTSGNAQLIWRALGEFGAPLAQLNIREADFTTPDIVAQFGLPPLRVDIMTSISGVAWEEAWADRFEGHLFELPVSFLGKESFVRNKLASGRPKDLRDVKSLEGRSS